LLSVVVVLVALAMVLVAVLVEWLLSVLLL
jgi:hypothetical protein